MRLGKVVESAFGVALICPVPRSSASMTGARSLALEDQKDRMVERIVGWVGGIVTQDAN